MVLLGLTLPPDEDGMTNRVVDILKRILQNIWKILKDAIHGS